MKQTPKIVRRIIDTIKGHNTFCIVGHVRPDGDCIGSQLALALALINYGKDVVCWNENPVPYKLKFLDPDQIFERPRTGRRFDCVISVDSASYERLGMAGDMIRERDILINVDHHPGNTRFGDINWVVAREPASGTLIYRLLKEANWPITQPIANCLFTAISTDTGSFQYPTTRPNTYHVAGELVNRGADLATISEEVYNSYSLSRIRLLRHVFNNFKLTDNNRIAYFWLHKSDFEKSGAQVDDAEGLIDHIRAIEPVEVACVFEEVEPELTRISFRSKRPDLDVNAIGKQFGGGGHRAAAGAKVAGDPEQLQRLVLKAIRAALKATENPA